MNNVFKMFLLSIPQDEHMPDDVGEDSQAAWKLPDGSHMTLRMSLNRSKVDTWDDEVSYRESLGTIMALRSEALGSLSGEAPTGKVCSVILNSIQMANGGSHKVKD